MARIKPTRRQKNLAKLTLEHPTMAKGELVALGGYGKAVVQTPSKALESLGYKESLAEYGLTEELITKSLVSDINDKPRHRFLELNLGAEILNMKDRGLKPMGTTISNFTQIIINTPDGRKNINDKPDAETVSSVASVTES